VPTQLTFNWSTCTTNSGISVAAGRVAKSFEVMPALFDQVPAARLRAPAIVSLHSLRSLNASMYSVPEQSATKLLLDSGASQFFANTAATVFVGHERLHVRLLRVDLATEAVLIRPELLNSSSWLGVQPLCMLHHKA
jgi:hypothetical protein